jgi:hypothetical protein
MGGGLMQLVAYGAQDVYLSGNPQITFFKVVYRRHSNFSMESIQQIFSGTTELGNRVTATISRNGDLIHKMYVESDVVVRLDNSFYGEWVYLVPVNNKFGHSLIKEVEIEIGGQLIDKHYSLWLDIWAELTVDTNKKKGYDYMTTIKLPPQDELRYNVPFTSKIYTPLQFWFCRNPGLALPLIALQYHEIKINILFETANVLNNKHPSEFAGTIIGITHPADNLANGMPGDVVMIEPNINASLWVDYIYLDTDERRRFAQVSHEYLIEQLQFTGSESAKTNQHRLNFNHPVKELIWVERKIIQPSSDFATSNEMFQYLECKNAKLQLNGHDRFEERLGSYFTLIQPYQHHTNIPNKHINLNNPIFYKNNNNIHVYSFALKPEDHQPSGTCNFSRIDNSVLSITPRAIDSDIYIYAVNYNVLRIMGGMGGLAYSN